MRKLRKARRPLVALVALVIALAVGYIAKDTGSGGHSPSTRAPSMSSSGTASRAGEVALSALPTQARQTIALIPLGGPFPYPDNDGVVFHNYEHALPSEPDGYYHEYTVPTPGSDDRGARRIVTGRDGRYWYTGDHYDSFRVVDVSR